jgi:hypothetical protein
MPYVQPESSADVAAECCLAPSIRRMVRCYSSRSKRPTAAGRLQPSIRRPRNAFLGLTSAFLNARRPSHQASRMGKAILPGLGSPPRRPAWHLLLDDGEQVECGTRKAVNHGNHHHVAGVELAHQPLELGPLDGRAADHLTKDGHAPGGLELSHTVSEVLGVGRNAGIALYHARIVPQRSASEKTNRISSLGVIHLS